MKQYYVVDRIENNYAVCERDDQSFISISIYDLYPTVKTGDWILFENGKYVFDEAKTEEKRNQNILLQNSLFED